MMLILDILDLKLSLTVKQINFVEVVIFITHHVLVYDKHLNGLDNMLWVKLLLRHHFDQVFKNPFEKANQGEKVGQ